MGRKPKQGDNRSPDFALDLDRLRKTVGETVFARGKKYHVEGRVEIISVSADQVRATVAGSETYNTSLFQENITGECSCPAFQTYGFCKHIVATALAAATSGDVDAAVGRADLVRDHLRGANVETLVEIILSRAFRDPEFLDELAFAAEVAGGADDEALFSDIKKKITRATRGSSTVDYAGVRNWAARIEPLVRRIESMIEAGRTAVALRLLDYFFDRMESALADIDDSDGDCGALCEQARDLHLKAYTRARPDPVALSRALFDRETKSGWDFFAGAAAVYEEVLGASGLAEYRRLAEEAWRSVKPARPADTLSPDAGFSSRYRLAAILDWFAEREGDLDARIAIGSKDLSSPYRYLEIAQLWMDGGRESDALRWAEEGLWQFEDSPDDRLIGFTAELYRRMGRRADADALLWRAFGRSASFQLYGYLKTTAGEDAAALAAVRDKAVSLMQAQLDQTNAGHRRRWQSPRDLLVQFAMREDMLELAWEIVSTHGCQEGLLISLAEASEISHPAKALTAYAGRVEQLVRVGGRDAYADACSIIQRMAEISERIGEHEAHELWLAELKLRHKAKRTFIALLNEAEGSAPLGQASISLVGESPSEVDASRSRRSSGSSRQ